MVLEHETYSVVGRVISGVEGRQSRLPDVTRQVSFRRGREGELKAVDLDGCEEDILDMARE